MQYKKKKGRKIYGTSGRPRLTVFRSNKHIYAQLIDDSKMETLVAVSSLQLERKDKTKQELAREVGKLLARKAKKVNISKVVFDRNIYKYHGRVKQLAEGAREGGLDF